METDIQLLKGDITSLEVDAIVNAANSSLMGGGGVDGAIHRAAGPSVLQQCMAIRNTNGGCDPGDAVVTGAGNLKAKYIIHTVGPIWTGGSSHERELLASCYRKSLTLAAQKSVRSIAFPNISTGVYHFPKPEAAEIALTEIKKFISNPSCIQFVIFACFDDENFSIYEKLLTARPGNDRKNRDHLS